MTTEIDILPPWSPSSLHHAPHPNPPLLLLFLLQGARFLFPSSFVQSLRNDVLEYYFREETEPGVVIGNIIRDFRLDARYSSAALVHFRFSQMASPTKFFSVDELTGDIRSLLPVDREDICAHLEDCVVQFDVAVQPIDFFRMIKVKVEIIDINDHSPVFPDAQINLFLSELTEPGAGFLIPGAVDPDSGSNGVQRYTIDQPSDRIFRLELKQSEDGVTNIRLTLKERLDREVQECYVILVLAVDGGLPAKTGSLLVNVSVNDSNDNSPRFERDLYEVTVAENTVPGTVILKVKATDRDTGRNAFVRYDLSIQALQEFGHLVHLDQETGLIRLRRELDFEQCAVYALSVTATDQGADPLTGYTSLVIRVQDVNDHSPRIAINTLTSNARFGHVRENAPIGTFVAHLSATDEDSDDNGKVSCAIDSPQFVLDPLYVDEFKVTTAVVLDREQRDSYVISVLCRDFGRHPLTSLASLRVHVLDENDNSPRFERCLYETSVVENSGIGVLVFHVTATDPDVGRNGRVIYRLSEEAKDFLHLNQMTGKITSTISFDYETIRLIEFELTAEDMGVAPKTSKVQMRVKIEDRDDHSPIFKQEKFFFRVAENQPSGTPVGHVDATDSDSSNSFNRIVYRIRSSVLFQIDPTSGLIRTTEVLDREAQTIHQLVVIATPPVHQSASTTSSTSSVDVVILVDDVNDHWPKFLFPSNDNETVFVSKRCPRGHVVSRLTAIDNDAGLNARLTFELVTSSRPHVFAVDRSTGDVTLTDDVSAITMETVVLHVRVTDAGNPSLSDETLLRVTISSDIEFREGHDFLFAGYKARVVLATVLATITIVIGFLLVTCFRRRGLCWIQGHLSRSRSPDCGGPRTISKGGVVEDAGRQLRQQTGIQIYDYPVVTKATAIVRAFVVDEAQNRKDSEYSNDKGDVWSLARQSDGEV